MVPNKLFEHYMFYDKHLRQNLSTVKSRRAFVPLLGSSGKLNQTHVGVTSSFKLAKVLKPSEESRVCCTNIRCGIVTYAYNEGGFDRVFFAKHFMRNREETTSMH